MLGELKPGGRLDDRARPAAAITLLHPPGYDYFRLLRSKLHWGLGGLAPRALTAVLRYLQIRDFAIIDAVELEFQPRPDGADRRDRRRQVHHRRCAGAAVRAAAPVPTWCAPAPSAPTSPPRSMSPAPAGELRHLLDEHSIEQWRRAAAAPRGRQRRAQPRLAQRPDRCRCRCCASAAGAAVRDPWPARISVAGAPGDAARAGRQLWPARVPGRRRCAPPTASGWRCSIAASSSTAPPDERGSRLDLLRYQLHEIEALQLKPGELAELKDEHARLANRGRLIEAVRGALECLYESEGATAQALLARSHRRRCAGQPRWMRSSLPLMRAARGGRSSRQGRGPHAAAVPGCARARSAARRRHRAPAGGDRGTGAQASARAGGAPGRAARQLAARAGRARDARPPIVGAVRAQLTAATRRLPGARAPALGPARHRRARTGQGDLRAHAGARHGRRPLPDRRVAARESAEPAPHGFDRVEFRVSTNPGQPPRAIAKVASGGELARLSLAVQVSCAGRRGLAAWCSTRSTTASAARWPRSSAASCAPLGEHAPGTVRDAPAAGGGSGTSASARRQAQRRPRHAHQRARLAPRSGSRAGARAHARRRARSHRARAPMRKEMLAAASARSRARSGRRGTGSHRTSASAPRGRAPSPTAPRALHAAPVGPNAS